MPHDKRRRAYSRIFLLCTFFSFVFGQASQCVSFGRLKKPPASTILLFFPLSGLDLRTRPLGRLLLSFLVWRWETIIMPRPLNPSSSFFLYTHLLPLSPFFCSVADIHLFLAALNSRKSLFFLLPTSLIPDRVTSGTKVSRQFPIIEQFSQLLPTAQAGPKLN